MSYPVIPSNLKNVESVYLRLMSSEEMLEMSYGQVLTGETINYRTGVPQTNGLFCQAIFGPVKDWECFCGKYKRYRYAGVICDKCGVQVAHSSVRRERMGHIDLAAPCVHPWFLRIIPSRIALLLDMKSADISRICYFSAYVITKINENMKQEYLTRIEQESQSRIKSSKGSFDEKFEELGKQFQKDKSSGKFDIADLKVKYEADKEILKNEQNELSNKIHAIAEIARKELISLKVKDVINENIHQELAQKFGPVFTAEIGAEAIETLLRQVELEKEFENLKQLMLTTKSQIKKKLSKKLKLVKNLIGSNTNPTWMILRRIMVLPPDLRPMLQLEGGRFAASDLNDLYRRLINRNNRLRKLIHIGAPEVILRNEKRMLQEAVEALIDNTARNGKQVMASTGAKRPLKSLTDSLKGKGGRFRQNLLGKRVDYSGRSVIIIGPNLKLNECGLPKDMALELFKPFLIGRIIAKSEKGLLPEEYQSFNIYSARRLIDTKKPIVFDILDEVIQNKYVLLNRAPTLHRLGFLAFKPILTEGKAIQIHPMVCKGFNADFDGDNMAVHLPITVKGQEEARTLMTATHNLMLPANGKLIMGGSQDLVLGVYYLTNLINSKKDNEKIKYFSSQNEALFAYNNQYLKINEPVKVKVTKNNKSELLETSVGRIIFNNCFPNELSFINETITSKSYNRILGDSFHSLGNTVLTGVLDKIKETMFKYATVSGISISVDDIVNPIGKHSIIEEAQNKVTKIQKLYELGFLSENGKHKEIVNLWRQAGESVFELTASSMNKENNIGYMILSGARGNTAQLNFMAGMRGQTQDTSGNMIELPAVHAYLEGLSPLEYFITMKGHRKGLAGTALQTADAGYLTRRLVDVAQNLIIMGDDCHTEEGIEINKHNSEILNKSVYDRLYGRFLLKDVLVDGKVIATSGSFVDRDTLEDFKKKNADNFYVRTVTKCQLNKGVCKKCYGIDFSTHNPVELGVAVGVIGAQSMGEPATQLAVGSVKHGVAAGSKADITTGLPRVEEILEARTPKYIAPMALEDGVISKIEGSVDQGFKIFISPSTTPSVLSLTTDENKVAFSVKDGQEVEVGDMLYITSSGQAIMADKAGLVSLESKLITISPQSKELVEYDSIPGAYLLAKSGDKIVKGQALAEGSLDLQALLDITDIDSLKQYIVKEVNYIYANNGIDVDEKHIEIIIKQMCNRGQIIDSGDSDFIIGDIVRLSVIRSANKNLISKGLKPATFKPVVTGISRASLSTDSFLSAASFQETARVLVEAVLSARKDQLYGLKENVILGQLIPSGTGFNESKLANLVDSVDEFEVIESTVVEE
jgi:DNA-directed RNA polymerase subunit beta'